MQKQQKNANEEKKANEKKANKKKGFSLVELSIVILIVSILITGSLGISKTAINNSKVKVTRERMDTVYKAFGNYLAVNRRLPCPALLTVAKGTAGYGSEAATPGTCTSTYISTVNSANLVYGMVPVSILNLDPDMAEDGWGTKFTYVVDKRFTKQSVNTASVDGFEIIKGTPAEVDTGATDLLSIDAQSPAGTSILSNKNAIFLLLSHGANKFNGFNATGTVQNGVSTIPDENDNSCNQLAACVTSVGGTTYDREFVINSADPNFDDIALFKSKTQLVRDAGLEFMMCSASEAQTASLTWTAHGSYGCYVCSTTANNNKTCGKYGAWSSSSTTTCTASTTVCSSVSSTDPDMVIYTDNTVGNGGTFTAGAWTKRLLTTTRYEKDVSGSFVLNGSNQVVLQPGKYYIKARALAEAVDRHVLRFQNITNGSTDIQGNSSFAQDGSDVGSTADLVGVVTVVAPNTFELQHRCSVTNASFGLGVDNGFLSPNIFVTLEITRLS